MSDTLEPFVQLALDCVHRAYPSQVAHLLRSDADARPPRELTPAFYGCFDWHSAVHGHWLLAVGVERSPRLSDAALEALGLSLTEEKVAGEAAYVRARPGFERPYGLAWLLALHQRLHQSHHPRLVELAAILEPLVDIAVTHLAVWLPKLSAPTRSGVHSQTAFALGLAIDWARGVGRAEPAALFEAHARALFADDRDYALHLEPGGEDFLSPSLGAADVMARLSSPDALAAWLDRAMPELARPGGAALTPARVSDPADGRLAHLDGLNLSRAWMLRSLSRALPASDARRPALEVMAEVHAEAGLAAVSDTHYAGSHWLGTFAAYLLERQR